MFQELAKGIGGAVIILAILFFVVNIFRSHEENRDHRKMVEEDNRQKAKDFPELFGQKPTEQP